MAGMEKKRRGTSHRGETRDENFCSWREIVSWYKPPTVTGEMVDGECISFCDSAISFQFGATRPPQIAPSSVFAPSEHRLPPVNRKNKSRSWFKLIRAVIDNGLSYICSYFSTDDARGEGNAREGRHAIIYTTCLLKWHLSGFDIERTEKSTAIRFSIHSIEINFPFLHDRFPGEDTRRGMNVRQREGALSTQI